MKTEVGVTSQHPCACRVAASVADQCRCCHAGCRQIISSTSSAISGMPVSTVPICMPLSSVAAPAGAPAAQPAVAG